MPSGEFSDLIAPIASSDRIDESCVSRLKASFHLLANEDRVECVIKLLSRLQGRFDWYRFNDMEEFIADGASLDDAYECWRARHSVSKANADHWDPLEQHPWLSEFEQRIGLHPSMIAEVLKPLGECAPSNLELNDLLPNELLPSTYIIVADERYDHLLHRFVRDLLNELGSQGRKDTELVQRFGSHISCLFDHNTGEESPALEECLHRVDGYLAANKDDPFALLWRGELACWQNNKTLAKELAKKFWLQCQDFDESRFTRALQLLEYCGSDNLYEHMGCVFLEDEPYRDHIGMQVSTWIDSNEQLTGAVVRRAVQLGHWDTEFLDAFRKVQTGWGYDLDSHELLPASCWIWIAEHPNTYERYDAWEAAFLAADSAELPNESFLASVVLLAGRLLNMYAQYTWRRKITVKQIVENLEAIRSAGTLADDVEQVIARGYTYSKRVEPDHLTAADRLALSQAASRIDANVTEASTAEVVDAGKNAIAASYPQDKVLAEKKLASYLGQNLWVRLDAQTKRHLVDGEIAYQQKVKSEGEDDFGTAILQFSHGLLNEIRSRLWRHVWLDAKVELQNLGGNTGRRNRVEWVELIKVLENYDKLISFNKVAARKHIFTDVLAGQTSEMQSLVERRNKAAHGEPVDREDAALLYNTLIQKGSMKTILGALHGKRP